ncbi:MAG: four-carbon acid sugar kinase family protein [Ndongobacter sp.]|nr:four-carbon acid sugar kinase family protein [Ndongobacter sp.]
MKMTVIADDFTGALDTAVQFVQLGIPTAVALQQGASVRELMKESDVAVFDTQSRHTDAQEAYRRVRSIAERAVDVGCDIIYKKTDSALRGNIGAELAAVADAVRQSVHFVPAFPRMARTTKGGVQFSDGVPVSETGFGRDPLNPVRQSHIPDLIARQAPEKACVVVAQGTEEIGAEQDGTIFVYDAETDEELRRWGAMLLGNAPCTVLAGCAGFASVIGRHYAPKHARLLPLKKTEKMAVLCGSVNPITRRQVERAEKEGFVRLNVRPEQFLDDEYFSSPAGKRFAEQVQQAVRGEAPVMICTMDVDDSGEGEKKAEEMGLSRDEMARRITHFLGRTAQWLLEQNADMTLVATGGDTLSRMLQELGVVSLAPLCEIGNGAVASRAVCADRTSLQIVSKSGGFGAEDIFLEIQRRVTEEA